MQFRTPLVLALSLWMSAAANISRAAEDLVGQFEREVRPILEEHCFECHGPDKQKGGLRLDLKSGMLDGGDSGEPVIIPGKSNDSPLVKIVSSADPHERMPPKGEPLKAEQVLILKSWIEKGAHFPELKPGHEEPVAVTKGMVVTDHDREFWAFQSPRSHEAALISPSTWPQQPVDRFILARLQQRGLEPSQPASQSTLLRRLTFDLTGLPPSPEELREFLSDQSADPYERAVERLLSSARFGERMASLWLPLARYGEDQAHQVGNDTKFFYPNAYVYRAWVIDAFNRDLPYDRFLELQLAADRLPCGDPNDLAALGFLGLGPKYYNRDRLEVKADEWEDRVDTVTRAMLGLTVACARCHDHKFDPIPTRDYYALAGVFASTRMINKTPSGQVEKEGSKAGEMNPATLHIVEDGEVQNLNVFVRGNVTRKGELAPRQFLSVLTGEAPAFSADGSGRLDLAEAIANRENPLTARVFVNRVWGLMFGRPLVATPSNFGNSGARAEYPELLDDLAVRFMEQGWSVKSLVREMVLSSTYRQDSVAGSDGLARDPDNTLLGRMNRRRLSVEQWRDTVLLTSGELTESVGAKSKDLEDNNNHLRTVYARVSRLKLNDLLMQWDYPDANVHAEKRSMTVTPIQKLFVLNSGFMQRQANALAARLQGSAEADEERVSLAYRLLFAREPAPDERTLALDFLRKPNSSQMSRWDQYAQLLLASNEMLYVD